MSSKTSATVIELIYQSGDEKYRQQVWYNVCGMPKHKSKINEIDMMAYAAGIAGNIAIIPQIIKAWQGPAPGLAISTWLLFLFVDLSWLIYAIRRKQRPLLFTEAMGLLFYVAVISGWMLHHQFA